MELKDFVTKYNIEKTENLVDCSFLKDSEKVMKVALGNQLSDYLTNYGYLAYKYIELYGMNSVQKLKSDMIIETVYLHENFDKTNTFIALEDKGDGLYVLVSQNDDIYSYDTDADELKNIGIKLNDYIMSLFRELLDI